MNLAFLLLASVLLLGAGYLLWGRRVSRWAGVDASRPTPAVRRNDGTDFVPTRAPVLLGHHFASIAAAGPIVGPTLALAYGYLPPLLWILLGVVFIGAVHDFLALFLSVREDGSSIAEVARRALGRTGYLLFLCFALALCVLVCAAFLDLTALALTSTHRLADLHLPPDQTLLRAVEKDGEVHGVLGGIASTSVVLVTAFAPLIGWLLTRRAAPVALVSVLALGVCAFSVAVGFAFPITLEPRVWMGLILAYTLVSSSIPVWLVLQPRDFVNVHLLYLGMAAMVGGILVAGLGGAVLDAPALAVRGAPREALGALWPFLFVTIACGSVSGAHALIASGTTSKQLASESHARPIGYGGMLMEALLGVAVALIVLGGLGFARYQEVVWPEDGRGNAALAFAAGVGGILHRAFGLAPVHGTVFGILLLEGFLVTTVDTIVRLMRYLMEELWRTLWREPPRVLRSRLLNTLLPVLPVALLAFTAGYKLIWPVFGSANQLLAALTLTTAAVWLYRRGRRWAFAALPALFMVATTLTSLALLLVRHLRGASHALVAADALLLLLAAGFVWIAARTLRRAGAQRRNAPLTQPSPPAEP